MVNRLTTTIQFPKEYLKISLTPAILSGLSVALPLVSGIPGTIHLVRYCHVIRQAGNAYAGAGTFIFGYTGGATNFLVISSASLGLAGTSRIGYAATVGFNGSNVILSDIEGVNLQLLAANFTGGSGNVDVLVMYQDIPTIPTFL